MEIFIKPTWTDFPFHPHTNKMFNSFKLLLFLEFNWPELKQISGPMNKSLEENSIKSSHLNTRKYWFSDFPLPSPRAFDRCNLGAHTLVDGRISSGPYRTPPTSRSAVIIPRFPWERVCIEGVRGPPGAPQRPEGGVCLAVCRRRRLVPQNGCSRCTLRRTAGVPLGTLLFGSASARDVRGMRVGGKGFARFRKESRDF